MIRAADLRWRDLALWLTVVGGAVLLWWVAAAVVWRTNPVISRLGPTDAVPAWLSGMRDGRLLSHLGASLSRLLGGLFVAVAVGVPLGVLLGSRQIVETATAPVINFLRMISPMAWAPVVIVAFGVGSAPVVFLIAITAVWPVALGTAAGVKAVAPGWRAVARSLGATPWEQVRLVTAPAVRGSVLTSLRLSLGVAWVVLVPAEMLGVDSGLGYAVLNARDQLDYAGLGGAVLMIGLVGVSLDAFWRRVLSR